jgi:hypothetical protein
VIGGLGASLMLPAMQSLVHGNFRGAEQRKVYALLGSAAAIAAAVGPLLGGFLTTYLSWRVGFLLEVVVIAIVLLRIRALSDVPYEGPREIDLVGAALSVVGMGGLVLGVLVWQEGGESVGALLAGGAIALGSLAYWLLRRERGGKPTLLAPDLFRSKVFQLGVSLYLVQQIALGGLMIVLPIYLQLVLGYSAMEAGLSLAPLSLTIFGISILAARRAGRRRPTTMILVGCGLLSLGVLALIPLVPRIDTGWYLVGPLVVAGAGFGLVVSQLNNYTLSPISDERASEGAGVYSASGSFGLSLGLAGAGAIMLATLSIAFTNLSDESSVLPAQDKEHVASVLEDDAEIMSDAQLAELLADEPGDVRGEIISINNDARDRALQVALLVPLLAGLLGLGNSVRMVRRAATAQPPGSSA